MSQSRRRPREEEEQGPGETTAAAATTPTTTTPSLFSMELEKNARALREHYNTILKNTIVKKMNECMTQSGNTSKNDSTTSQQPEYTFWNAVAEYKRAQREIEQRYGGGVGDVYCFGSNEMFQQGLPDLTDLETQDVNNMTPHQLGVKMGDGAKSFRQVAAGGTSLAALDIHGNVYTWGSSDDGVLGRIIKKGENADKSQATPTVIKGFVTATSKTAEDGQITQVDVGAAHMIYLSAAGNVYFNGVLKDGDSGMFSPPHPDFVPQGLAPAEPAWYEVPKGQEPPAYSKQPDTYGIRRHKATPIHLPALRDIVAVYSGDNFCAVLTKERDVLTFGFGNFGELARSPTITSKDEETGEYDLSTKLYKNPSDESWGWYNMDLLRDKFLTPLPVQYDTLGKRKVLNLACGGNHLLVAALDSDGKARLYAAGLNQYGQLGLGDKQNRHVLTKVPFFNDKITIGQVAAGAHFSLGLSHGGDTLYSWGRGDYGSLGIGPEAKKSWGSLFRTPQRVHIPYGVWLKNIAAGETTGMATTIDDELYTWGYEGVTGHGGRFLDDDCPTPRLLTVSNVNSFHSMSCGSQHGVFIGTWDSSKDRSNKEEDQAKESEPQAKRQRRA